MITIDNIIDALSKTVFSPAVAVAVFASIYFGKHNVRDYLKSHKALRLYFIFMIIKSVNYCLTRLVRNNFVYFPDKPKWEKGYGKGDVVLITGGSTGIGKEVVDRISQLCDKVAVFDLAEPTYKPKPGILFYRVDVTNAEQIHEAATRVREELGEPTIIYNNAGIARGDTILNVDPKFFLKTYKINVIGPLLILKEFLPHIVKINHGHIVTTASSAAYMSITQMSDYSASKVAVLSLHDTLRQELLWRYKAPRVRTSVICPAKVTTVLGDHMKEQELQFFMPTLKPEQVAQAMVDAVQSGLSQHITMPRLASWLFPFAKALPDWFKYSLDVLGDTMNTITNEGNAAQSKHYNKVLATVEKEKDALE